MFTAVIFSNVPWANRCENASKISRTWIVGGKRYGEWKESRCRRDGKSQLRGVRSFQVCTARGGQGKGMVGKEKDMNYHMEKLSPSVRIADVLCSGAIYSPFLETNQREPEEGEISSPSWYPCDSTMVLQCGNWEKALLHCHTSRT